MIYKALSAVINDMNEYFRHKISAPEDHIILSAIANQDGSIAIQNENKVIATIVNIQKDVVLKTLGYNTKDKVSDKTTMPINIVLHVLFSARFNSYSTSLQFISDVLFFFHSKNTFNKSNSPALPANIEKIEFEEENLNSEQLNNVWSTIGAKYLPSVMYKVKVLASDADIIREQRA